MQCASLRKQLKIDKFMTYSVQIFLDKRLMEFLHKNEITMVLCGGLSKGQRPSLEVH